MGLKPVSVSRLNAYIKRILQSDPILGNVSVIGEISNLKYHSSGHVYFTLKDENSKISCFLSSEQRRHLRYELDNGMEITATGYIYLYERGGSYSLNINNIEISGLGDLQIAFQQLKDKLQKEGLFDVKYKKPLPAYPKKVAVVTSPTGAAVRDVISIISGRTQLTDILVCPCLVQGPEASKDIARTIEAVNAQCPDVDVMIVGRGGGSMEELWAFNEEIVARAIFLSKIPVISAVGHETDFTIADYVADKRAETPTAAAQMAVPDSKDLQNYIEERRRVLADCLNRILKLAELRLQNWAPQRMRDFLHMRIERSEHRIQKEKQHLGLFLSQKLHKYELQLLQLEQQLQLKNPSLILERGCGILFDDKGKTIRSVQDTSPGQTIRVRLTDGTLNCEVTDVESQKGSDKP
ncbi:MAG: exodeoxyribonuclease VII large subunit [Firmicutes bacterium]|nr:exodeoxyribonuclease VII large subunit [Bacillota bacterium]